MEQSENVKKLNYDIVHEIVVCMETYATEQKIGKPPVKIQGIHPTSLLQKLNKNRKKPKKSFSPTTLNKYMKVLFQAGIAKNHVESRKNIIYELDKAKAEKWLSNNSVFNNMLVNFCQLKNTLDFYDRKAYFGFFEPEQFEAGTAPPQTKALAEFRDGFRETANLIDNYLKQSEANTE